MKRQRPNLAPEERHRRAIAQTIRWAREAASAGDYQDALSWMRVLEAVDGELPAELGPLLERCLTITRDRAAAHDARRSHLADAA